VYNAVFKNRLVRAFLKGTPGLEAWSMLGKAFYHACPPRGEPDYDLVIVDAPATGHALDMLRVPFVIESIAPPGILRRDAARAVDMFRDPERAGAVLVTLPEYMPASETIELADALSNELRVPILHLVINRVLSVLFAEKERPVLETLPAEIGEDSTLWGLAMAGRRRVLRETVQARAVSRICGHIDAPCSELPHYDGLEKDTEAIEALSQALLRSL
ncbi:MAG: chromosome partitioning protein, partial [Myxococcales bacterium]|nr:chromosome partitioning protein [Myxococcales bacterium]